MSIFEIDTKIIKCINKRFYFLIVFYFSSENNSKSLDIENKTFIFKKLFHVNYIHIMVNLKEDPLSGRDYYLYQLCSLLLIQGSDFGDPPPSPLRLEYFAFLKSSLTPIRVQINQWVSSDRY